MKDKRPWWRRLIPALLCALLRKQCPETLVVVVTPPAPQLVEPVVVTPPAPVVEEPPVLNLNELIGFGYAGGRIPGAYLMMQAGDASANHGKGGAIDADRNTYVVGNRAPGTSSLVALSKFNPAGALQWTKTLDISAQADYPYQAACDAAGNVYIVGRTYLAGTLGAAFVAKYNSEGTVQWQRTLTNSGTQSEEAKALKVTPAGDVFVVVEMLTGTTTVTLVKYNTSGTLQWQRKLSGAYSARLSGIATDSSGNIYLGGSFGPQLGVIKLSSDGATTLWARHFYNASTDGSVAADYIVGVAVDSADNVYIQRGTDIEGYTIDYSMALAKYNSSGTIQWQREISDIYPGIPPCDLAIGPTGVIYSAWGNHVRALTSNGQTQSWINSFTGGSGFIGKLCLDDDLIGMPGTVNSSPAKMFFSNLKLAGTISGTYGGITITANTTPAATTAGALTDADGSSYVTNAAGALTDAAGGMTAGTATLTGTVYTMT